MREGVGVVSGCGSMVSLSLSLLWCVFLLVCVCACVCTGNRVFRLRRKMEEKETPERSLPWYVSCVQRMDAHLRLRLEVRFLRTRIHLFFMRLRMDVNCCSPLLFRLESRYVVRREVFSFFVSFLTGEG